MEQGAQERQQCYGHILKVCCLLLLFCYFVETIFLELTQKVLDCKLRNWICCFLMSTHGEPWKKRNTAVHSHVNLFNTSDSIYVHLFQNIINLIWGGSHQVKIVSPGCGLGRLTWEIAQKGLATIGSCDVSGYVSCEVIIFCLFACCVCLIPMTLWQGFASQGNEFSYFMLLTSYTILNWLVEMC